MSGSRARERGKEQADELTTTHSTQQARRMAHLFRERWEALCSLASFARIFGKSCR